MNRKLSEKADFKVTISFSMLRDEVSEIFRETFPGHYFSAIELINAIRKHSCLGYSCGNDGIEEVTAADENIVIIYNMVAKRVGYLEPLRLAA